jgi:hypothetical protein
MVVGREPYMPLLKVCWRCAAAIAVPAMLFFAPAAVRAAPASATLVVCAPGSPGTTDEAQPRMDAFAAAISAKAGAPIAAVYEPSEAGGTARLQTAGIGLVSLPFFLAHEKELGLHARLQAMAKGRPPLDHWALVAQKGRVAGPEALGGVTIVSSVAFAPAFVRGTVLGGFGPVPANAKLQQSTAVLSSLRKAADGAPIAVLLDGTQEASLASLPFASKLEIVTRSPPLPAGLVVTIDARMPAKIWSGIEGALVGLAADRNGAAVLDGVQLAGFAPVDGAALDLARKRFADAQR